MDVKPPHFGDEMRWMRARNGEGVREGRRARNGREERGVRSETRMAVGSFEKINQEQRKAPIMHCMVSFNVKQRWGGGRKGVATLQGVAAEEKRGIVSFPVANFGVVKHLAVLKLIISLYKFVGAYIRS